MKQVLGLFALFIVIFLFIFFAGTKPAPKEETSVIPSTASSKSWASPPEMKIDINKSYTATIETSKGTIKADLFVKEAPKTVNNFVFLAREGFYDGVVFHRIIKDFMVQTGDPQGNGTGGPGYKFADEPVTRDYKIGTLAMANSGPNTNGSQFFIITKDYQLPKQYTIFGSINLSDTNSLKTLTAIADTPVEEGSGGEKSKPKETVTIEKVTIEEK